MSSDRHGTGRYRCQWRTIDRKRLSRGAGLWRFITTLMLREDLRVFLVRMKAKSKKICPLIGDPMEFGVRRIISDSNVSLLSGDICMIFVFHLNLIPTSQRNLCRKEEYVFFVHDRSWTIPYEEHIRLFFTHRIAFEVRESIHFPFTNIKWRRWRCLQHFYPIDPHIYWLTKCVLRHVRAEHKDSVH